MAQTQTIQYFQVFFETCHTILSSSSGQDILQQLVRRTAQALGAKGASLRLIDEKTGRLELAAAFGLSDQYLNKGPLQTDQSVPEALQGKVVVIRNAFDDPRIQYRQELRAEGINTMLSVPVIARDDQVIGVLRLYTAEPRSFSDEELEFAAALAEMGGLAIANARAFEAEGLKLATLLKAVGEEIPVASGEIRRPIFCIPGREIDSDQSLAYFRALHDVTRAILSTRDSNALMELINAKVLALVKVKGCALRLVDETTHQLELLAAKGLSEEFLHKGPLHSDRSIHETLEGTPVLIADAQNDPRVEYPDKMRAEGIRSILSLPIVAFQRVIGILRLYAGEARDYGEDEVAFLSALAEVAGIVIVNARLYEKTQHDLSFWSATLDFFKSGNESDR